MTASRGLALAALTLAAFFSCKCAPVARSTDGHMAPTYTLLPAAAGASRLYLGSGSSSLVAEHRGWLDEAYHERASEAPGVLQLVRADGKVTHTVSGWALGPPIGDDMAWLEETGEEYRDRITRTGSS